MKRLFPIAIISLSIFSQAAVFGESSDSNSPVDLSVERVSQLGYDIGVLEGSLSVVVHMEYDQEAQDLYSKYFSSNESCHQKIVNAIIASKAFAEKYEDAYQKGLRSGRKKGENIYFQMPGTATALAKNIVQGLKNHQIIENINSFVDVYSNSLPIPTASDGSNEEDAEELHDNFESRGWGL